MLGQRYDKYMSGVIYDKYTLGHAAKYSAIYDTYLPGVGLRV